MAIGPNGRHHQELNALPHIRARRCADDVEEPSCLGSGIHTEQFIGLIQRKHHYGRAPTLEHPGMCCALNLGKEFPYRVDILEA